MNPVGVMAVVEGLSSFLGDIGQINGALNTLKPPTSVLETAFGAVTDALAGFGREILNVAEVALGTMLRDAIEWIIGLLRDMAGAAFEAGAEFQAINLRLQGFNLQTLVDSGVEFNAAMEQSVAVTKEQMSWIMKLAATTPYDATDIAFVFSMSEAFGFTAEEAKTLTAGTLDFVAAMGLSGVEAKRVIINLGQMAQRGKITTREMNDLARGSLVPLSDVLGRVAEKMGITTEALTKLISKPGEGVDYQLFIDSFNEMVDQEVRFQGASERMAHTFKGAWENVTQTIRDVIGNFIILPGILDPVGNIIAGIMDTIGGEGNWEQVIGAAQRIGDALKNIVENFYMNFGQDPSEITAWIIGALNGIADWITLNSPSIMTFFGNLRDILFGKIKEKPEITSVLEHLAGPALPGVLTVVQNIVDGIQKISDFIMLKVVPAFNEIKRWVEDNGPLLNEFFTTLGEIVGDVVSNLFGGGAKGDAAKSGGIYSSLDKLKEVLQFIIDHEDDIANFITQWITLWFYLELIKAALSVIITTFENLLKNPFYILAYDASVFLGILDLIKPAFKGIDDSFIEFMSRNWGETLGKDIIDKIKAQDWFQAGVTLVNNIIEGMDSMLGVLAKKIVDTINNALNSIGLPDWLSGGGGDGGGDGGVDTGKNSVNVSKSGKSSIFGVQSAGKVQPSLVSSNSPTSNTFNLTVNSRTTKESVVSDFKTLKSMVGG